MNLADAIRKAAQQQAGLNFGASTPAPEPTAEVEVPAPVFTPAYAEPAPVVSEAPEHHDEDHDEDHEHHSQPGGLVRLELFLSPEQMHNLFKAVLASQHTMLTAREAAAYLRVPSHSLETLAQEGQIPAFQVDGRWRFTKQGIDEWLHAQQLRKESA